MTFPARLAPLALLSIPFFSGAPWSLSDYALAGALLWGAGSFVALLLRLALSWRQRVGLALGLATVVLLLVSNAALGIIGAEDHPANRLYVAVPVVGLAGALITRGRLPGLANTLLAMAVAQALVAPVALLAQVGTPWPKLPQIALINLFFVLLFLSSGQLLRKPAVN